MDQLRLQKKHGKLYSQELRIDVNEEPLRWFLASILFGTRISTTIAKDTFKAYEEVGPTTPARIAWTDAWTLIQAHGQGRYVRHDGITTEYMLDIAKKLLMDYDGDLRKPDESREDPSELERRLLEFRKVGLWLRGYFLENLEKSGRTLIRSPSSFLIWLLISRIRAHNNELEKSAEYFT